MSNQKGFTPIILILIFIFLVLGLFGAYFYFIFFPDKLTREYISSNKEIVVSLNKEIEKFENDDFLAARNIKLEIKDAQSSLQLHIANLDDTKLKVSSLSAGLQKLKPTKKTGDLHLLSQEQFNLSQNILEDFGNDLLYRKKVFEAFGSLPQQLEAFQLLFYKGGEREYFIITTDKIRDLAQQTLYALDNINVPQNDQDDFEYRKTYVSDIKDTFERVNDDYRFSKYPDVEQEIGQLSKRIEDSNKKFEAAIEKYAKDSSVARYLEEFKSKDQSIQNILNSLTKL